MTILIATEITEKFYVSLSNLSSFDFSMDAWMDSRTSKSFDEWKDTIRAKVKNGFFRNGKLVLNFSEAQLFDTEEAAHDAVEKSRFRDWDGAINPI
jgi:hypothetical protein